METLEIICSWLSALPLRVAGVFLDAVFWYAIIWVPLLLILGVVGWTARRGRGHGR